MAAAVSDFLPQNIKGKIKKSEHLDGLNLHLSLNEDLLANCNFKGKKIGFKMELESNNALKNAKKALQDKKLDMICLNIINQNNYFGSDKNELYFITSKSQNKSLLQDKKTLAFELAKECEKL